MRIIHLVFVVCAAGCGGKGEPAAEPMSNTRGAEPPDAGDPSAPLTDEQQAAQARAAADEAIKEAREAQERVERLAADLDAFDKELSAAVDAVASAQNDADRSAAKARLDELRKEKAELEARIQQVKTDAERAERKKGVKVPAHCIDNPLAKGCP